MACGVRANTKRTLKNGNTLLDLPQFTHYLNFVCTQHAYKSCIGLRRMWLARKLARINSSAHLKPWQGLRQTWFILTFLYIVLAWDSTQLLNLKYMTARNYLLREQILGYVASFLLFVRSIHNRHIKNPGPLPPRTLHLPPHLPHTTNSIPKITSIFFAPEI